MGAAVGSALPLAVGIAVSPVPIIAVILMLLSPRARVTSAGFLVGWLAGIAVAVVLFIALSSGIPPRDPNGSQPILGVIQIVLGVLLLLLAVRQWRSRPAPGASPTMPAWMAAISSFTLLRALLLGLLLAAANPKNLLLAASAGVAIGSAGIGVGETTAVVVIFTILAGSTVLVPVVAYLVASSRLTGPLNSLRHWLQDNNTAIMAVLLLVLGTSLIGKGVGSF